MSTAVTGVKSPSLTDVLNKQVANWSVLYIKLHHYHWYVTGPHFYTLHEKFEELYNEAFSNIDLIAERIRVFGMTPLSLIKDYLEHSTIKEVGTDLDSKSMVKEVLRDFEILAENMNECAEKVSELGDTATEDMLISFIKTLESNHWMLTSFNK